MKPRQASHTVPARFQEIVHRYPDLPAVLDKEAVHTYRDLDRLSDDIAAMLPENEPVIGIVLDHSVTMIASMLAVLKAGRPYVPAEPDCPPARIAVMFSEAGIRTVLTSPAFHDRLPRQIRFLDPDSAGPQAPFQAPEVSPEDPAYILYTSGSTGRPKGVCVRQRNLMHYVRAFDHEFHTGPGDIMLQNSVCTFDIFVEEVFTTLLQGACLAIPHTDDFDRKMDYCDRHGITVISGFPWLLDEMNRKDRVPETLRILISGGDTLHHAQIDRIRDRVRIWNTYGPSETTVCASYCCVNDRDPLADGTYPIGHPVLGAALVIADETGDPVRPGQTGEIRIFGNGVGAGYIGDHDRENRAFDGAMYCSGDLGYQLPDGTFVFAGRKDRQVMVQGKRVEPEEVESVMGRHAGIARCRVTTWMDEAGSSHLKAWLVLRNPDRQEEILQDLKAFMAARLTAYMMPETFTILERMPLTENGKIDEARLA